MDTYADLQAAIIARSHKPNLAARVPDFIRLAEHEINRRLSIFPKEATAPLTATPGSRFVPLPADFGSPLDMRVDGCDLVLLDSGRQLISTTRARPGSWAIEGGNIAFECPADKAYSLSMRYLKTLFLSDAAPTNDLFERAPDLYLYGALAELADHCRDDRGVTLYTGKFKALLRSVAADASRAKANAPLQTEITACLLPGVRAGRNGGFYGY